MIPLGYNAVLVPTLLRLISVLKLKMASGFDTSNVSDILAFLSESDDDSDLAADSDIVLDATEEVLQSSESDIYDERDSLFSGNGGKEDDEPGPSSRFTGTGRRVWRLKSLMKTER